MASVWFQDLYAATLPQASPSLLWPTLLQGEVDGYQG